MIKKLIAYSCIILAVPLSAMEMPQKIQAATIHLVSKDGKSESQQKQLTPQNAAIKARIEKYIGKHVYSPEFDFQESLRQIDLGIEELVKARLGEQQAETFFVNGWGQIIAALYLLQQEKLHKTINEEFLKFATEKVNEALESVGSNRNPFSQINVKPYSRPIIMYPHAGTFFPFKKVAIYEPVEFLNAYLENITPQFELFEGKLFLKLNPNAGKDGIFKELWKTNFDKLIQNAGYLNMKPNKFSAHITLVSSNALASIRKAAVQKYSQQWQEKYDHFFKETLERFNQELRKEKQTIIFTELAANYSEDASPFGEIIVAKATAPIVQKLLGELVAEVQEKFGVKIFVQDASAFHVTLAIHYREPLKIAGSMEAFLDKISVDHDILLKYWDTFKH